MAKEKEEYTAFGVARKMNEFGQIVKDLTGETTCAVSEKQAISHFLSRTKKELGLLQSSKLIFEGRVVKTK